MAAASSACHVRGCPLPVHLLQLIAELELHAAGQAEAVHLLQQEQASGREVTEATLLALADQLQGAQPGGSGPSSAAAATAAAVLAAARALGALTPAPDGSAGAGEAGADGGGLGHTRRRRDTAVLGSLVPLVREGALAAAPPADPGHNPATCRVPGCRRCAYLDRRAGQEAERAGQQAAAAPDSLPQHVQAPPAPASTSAPAAAVSQWVLQQQRLAGLPDWLQQPGAAAAPGVRLATTPGGSGSGSGGSLPGSVAAALAAFQPLPDAAQPLSISDNTSSMSSLESLLNAAEKMEMAASMSRREQSALLDLLHSDPTLLSSAAAMVAAATAAAQPHTATGAPPAMPAAAGAMPSLTTSAQAQLAMMTAGMGRSPTHAFANQMLPSLLCAQQPACRKVSAIQHRPFSSLLPLPAGELLALPTLTLAPPPATSPTPAMAAPSTQASPVSTHQPGAAHPALDATCAHV